MGTTLFGLVGSVLRAATSNPFLAATPARPSVMAFFSALVLATAGAAASTAESMTRLSVHGTATRTDPGTPSEGTAHGLGAELGVDMNRNVTITMSLDFMRFPSFEAFDVRGPYSRSRSSTLALFGSRFYFRGSDRITISPQIAAGLELRTTQSSFVNDANVVDGATYTLDRGALLFDVGLWVPVSERMDWHIDAGALAISGGNVARFQMGVGFH